MAAKKRTMTAEHKAAIASGRAEGAAVKRYLEVVQANRRPGRRVTKEQLVQRLAKAQQQVEAADNPLMELDLRQTVLDLEQRIRAADAAPDDGSAEKAFVAVAKGFAARKGISYTAFREMGVPAAVLKRAGIPQERTRAG